MHAPGKGSFVLRMYNSLPRRKEVEKLRFDLRSDVAIRSQALWMYNLQRIARQPIPEPIATLGGSFGERVSVKGVPGSRVSLLLRWMPGQQKLVEDAGRGFHSPQFTSHDAFVLGSLMAKLHLHAEDYSPPEGFVRPKWAEENLLVGEGASSWLLAEGLLSESEIAALYSASDRARECMRELGEARENFGIIHRDLSPQNIVFHEGTMYAIDFDHCGWGYYLHDLALPYMIFEHEQWSERRTAKQEALLKGYQQQRSLPDNYHEILEPFIAMRLMFWVRGALRNYHRLRKKCLDEIPEHPVRDNPVTQQAVDRLISFSAG